MALVWWQSGATALPLLKKSRELVLLALQDHVAVLGLVLGEAAAADVPQRGLRLSVLVLVRLLLGAAALVEPDADIVGLHEALGNSIDR